MVGVGNGEFVVASDGSAIIAHTSQAFALEDYQVVKITPRGFRTSMNSRTLSPHESKLKRQITVPRFM
jgi:glucosamine 6-phosphate synthetase-like amidotransferase/phosphosugar isomerase protein